VRDPLLVTYAEAGRLLRLSESTIKRLVRGRRLVRARISRSTARITMESIERFIAETTLEEDPAHEEEELS
jgi:hypothetical protein